MSRRSGTSGQNADLLKMQIGYESMGFARGWAEARHPRGSHLG